MGTLKTLFFILLMVNVVVCNVETKIRQEIITVTQHTASPRAKRDIYANPAGILNGDDFPDTMDFTLHLKESDYMIHLSKHVTPQDVKLRDQNGRIYFNSLTEKIQFAVYQDMETHSTMIVDCLDSSDSCTLEGSFHKDGIRWLLQSLKSVPGKYNVTEVPYDPYRVKMLNVPSLHKTEQQGVLEKIMEYFTKGGKRERRDIPVIRGQSIKTGDQTRDGRSVPDILGLKTDINHHVIKKRNIQTTCNIIEMQARVDATVYNFYLAHESDPHAAKVAIYRDLLQLFGQTDLRYKCLIEEGICIRVYLQDVFIEENAGTDFITESSMTGFYDAITSIIELGTRKSGGDLIAGFTRLRTDFANEPRFRGVGFGDTLCDGSQSDFQAVLLELTGDNDDLVMAQLMLYPMNVLWDGFYGCPDNETFVGAIFQVPPTAGNEHNPWQFSSCSITNIQNFLASRSDCLKDGDIDEKRLEAESTIRMMPGRMFDFDSLCIETYGSASTACQAAGETSIFDIDDICYLGVYCTLNGNCVNRTRVPNGFPCGCNEYCFKNKCVLGETVALGEACTGCCTCSEPNSDCDCETRTCTCDEGFYEAPNGTCIPGMDAGEPCSPGVQGTCDGENTVCTPNGTCECADGFVDCPGFGCLPYQAINEDCSCNEQCYRVSGVCIGFKCKCSDPTLYYVDFCGVCRNRVENNGNCSGEALCLDPKAFCDPHTQECVCSDETYDNNGTCTDLIPLGDPCTLEGSCEDCNAECLYDSCSCIPGFFEKNGVCIAFRYINEDCTYDIECMQVGGFCDMSGVCKCNETIEVVDECGICQNKSLLGQSCAGEHKCLDENAICNVDDICECAEGFFNNPNAWGQGSMGVCEEEVPLNETCNGMDEACEGGAICHTADDVCVCPYGYVVCPGDEACLPNQGINEDCSCNEQCYRVSGVCIDYKCKCSDPTLYYVDFCGVCQNRVENNGNCSGEGQCLDPKAFCDPHTQECICSDKTYDVNGTCTDLIPLGDPCTVQGSCEDCNAECLYDSCICIPGFFKKNGVCIAFRYINEDCTCDLECRQVGGYCDTSGVCKCNETIEFVDECGICQNRRAVGEDCTGQQVVCLDENAICHPINKTCLCADGFYHSNLGACEEKVPLNSSCPFTEACEDENSVCTAAETCQCMEGFVDCYTDSEAVCLPYRALNLPCECDEQCYAVNGVCTVESGWGVCKCPDNDTYYVDLCGSCQMRPILGEACTDVTPCLGDFAFCSPMSHTCVCVGPTFDFNKDAPGGPCLPLVPLGGNCTANEECEDANAVCGWDNMCQCADGYVDCPSDAVAECLPNQGINGECECSEQCEPVQGICLKSGVCKCPMPFDDYTVDDCGICQLKQQLGENCTDAVPCLGDFAYCDPCDEICVCSNGYYESMEGTCEPQVGLGENCTSTQECADCNSNCIDYMCQCGPGYSEQNGICEGTGALFNCCDPPTDENGLFDLVDNSTTEGSTAVLVCRDGYEAETVVITCTSTGWTTPSNSCLLLGCPDDWAVNDGSCYFVQEVHLTRNEARTFCNGAGPGSRLLVIDSLAENTFVKNYMSTQLTTEPSNGAWIGLVQNGTNGNEVWEPTGEFLNPAVSDWDTNQPDDSGGRQTGTMLWRDFGYRWADIEAANDYVSTAIEDDRREGYAFCEIDLDS